MWYNPFVGTEEKDMDIRLLRYFLAVAREENITRAAETLHIAQPSLSKQLMELESEIGKQLLVRGKRKITLTEDGILLRKRAEEIVALLEKTEEELRSDFPVAGECSIGGMPTMQILSAATSLRKAHPGVRFRFYASDANDILEKLDHGSIDFAVLLMPVDDVKYESFPLADSFRWGVIVPADHKQAQKAVVTKEDLRALPLVMHRREGLQREVASWANTDPELLDISAMYNVVDGDPAAFVRSGFGCFLTTEDHLASVCDPDVCFRPLDPPLLVHHALVWKRHAIFGKAASGFLAQIRQGKEPSC